MLPVGKKYLLIEDLKQYYQNWEKIIGLDAKMIYPAHGRIFKIEKLKKNLYRNQERNMRAQHG